MTLNYVKAVLAGIMAVCITFLLWQGSIAPEAGYGMLGTILGYVVGNGVQSRTGADIPGIIRPKPEGRRETDSGH